MAVGLRPKYFAPKANDTLTSGITKSNVALPICRLQDFTADGVFHRTSVVVNSLIKNIAADADEGFGEKLFTFPASYIQPLGCVLEFTSSTASGLSSTAGEVGLGTTIASGAVAVLSGTAGFQNILDGKTLEGLTSGDSDVETFLAAAGGTSGTETPIDATAGTVACHLNVASAWNQTAAENVTFSARFVLLWADLGTLPAA